MSNTTTNVMTEAICANANMAMMYAKKLLEGIEPSRFARLANGVKSNHPAFCYGHLSIYPDWLLGILGREELTDKREAYDALFKQATECRDDPDGTIYPPMDELSTYFFERTEALIKAVREADEETLAKPNPSEAMRDMLPTVGAVMMFMLGGHAMAHLGQVSAWRRIEGMDSAMGY